jgi:low affinity Fe/Cu permease
MAPGPRSGLPWAMRSWFAPLSRRAARAVGQPRAFLLACAVVAGWAALGRVFRYSDTWQLVINTGTTIVTFLMVFLIQNTQNRESAAVQIKLDELLRATRGAHNVMLSLDDLTDEELDALLARYKELARDSRERLRRGLPDTGAEDKPGLTEGVWPRAKL